MPVLLDSIARDSLQAPGVAARVMPWIWGGILSCLLLRFFFFFPPGVFHVNHEGSSYVSRVVEFSSLLAAGYPFPQWAVHFRGGLGSPYFGYYQPGFFYAASLFATVLPVVKAIGATLVVFSVIGYGGMLGLVGARFGAAGGALAGTALLLSYYGVRDLYLRGDLSEYCGMMLLPAVLCCLTGWLERGGREFWLGLAFGCAALVLMHPAAALFGYGALGITLMYYAIAMRSWRRPLWAGVALLGGAGMAAFFWLSVALEWQLVQGDLAIARPYQYFLHFIDPQELLGYPGRVVLIPVNVGTPFLTLLGVSTALLVLSARRVTPPQWRLVGTLWLLTGLCVFMMTPASEPVWAMLPLLQRVQFPWRFLLLLTVTGGALMGCTPVLARPVMILGIVWLAAQWGRMQPAPTDEFLMPVAPGEIATRFVRPDVMNEWLPRQASMIDPMRDPSYLHVRCEPECRMSELTRSPGRLQVRIEGAMFTIVTLPHYAFPVGWTSLVDGREEPPRILPPARNGLMRVVANPGERIELIFTTTPGRRLGAKISAASLVLLLLIAWFWLPRSAPDAPLA
jgi:hypothetical protein